MKNYFLAYMNIFNYKGESTIKQFWCFFLINIIVSSLIMFIAKKYSLSNYIYDTYVAISFLVFLSIGFRRIKNAGYSGWFILMPIVNIIFASLPSKEKQIESN